MMGVLARVWRIGRASDFAEDQALRRRLFFALRRGEKTIQIVGKVIGILRKL